MGAANILCALVVAAAVVGFSFPIYLGVQEVREGRFPWNAVKVAAVFVGIAWLIWPVFF